jgi:hypothetical protein
MALPHGGIALALSLGLAWQGLLYAAAPVVAAIAERDLRRHISTVGLTAVSPPEGTLAPVPLAGQRFPPPGTAHRLVDQPSADSCPSRPSVGVSALKVRARGSSLRSVNSAAVSSSGFPLCPDV